MWRQEGVFTQYLYHKNQPGQYGDGLTYSSGAALKSTWQTVTHRIKMNTPSQRNGILQAWVDGALVLNRNNIEFRSTNSVSIDKLLFTTFYGVTPLVGRQGLPSIFISMTFQSGYLEGIAVANLPNGNVPPIPSALALDTTVTDNVIPKS